MIDFDKNELNGQPIVRWEVRFRTIKGFHTSLKEAVEVAKETEMPPEMILPVPCACSKTDWEPVLR